MAEATLTFNPGFDARTFDVDSLVVEWKTNWEDEWEDAPFTCEEITWATCGDGKISSGVFRKRYGRGTPAGEFEATSVDREDDASRKFIRVTLLANLFTKKWYGVLGDDQQTRFGTAFVTDESGESGVSQGIQEIRALGLEYLLSQTFVRSAWIAKNLDAVESVETKRGLTFNRDGLPNCSEADDTEGGRFFHEGVAGGVGSIHWTTHQAVRYLLKRHAPLSFDGEAKIPFSLYDAGSPILPDFDFPQLETHGRSVYDLLCTLISRQRGYGFYLQPKDDESSIELRPFTFVREDVELDEDDAAKKLPANPSVWRLDIEADRSSGTARLIKRTTERFDRVIVQGARRRTCFTVSFADGTLQNDWREEDETAYNEGASTAGDYPGAAEIEERQRRDEEARNDPDLRDVFSRFRFPEEWDLKAGSGEGEGDEPILLADVGDEAETPSLYLPEVRVLRTLPLLETIDYGESEILDHLLEEEEPINADERTLPEMVPFGLLKINVDLEAEPPLVRWLRLDTLENMAVFPTAFDEEVDLRWSAEVEPTHDVPGFTLPVRGAPQHVIAADRFEPVNPPAVEGRFDYEDFIFTVAIEEDRYCEGMHEEEPTIGADAVRTLILEAGDAFRKDYVVPGTVVGVDGTTGQLVRTTSGGYVRDDTKQLKETARLAFEWYKVGRVALAYQTGDMERTLQLPLGGYIRSIGRESVATGNHNQEIESVVTEISARFGTASGPHPPAPVFAFRTDYVELDMRRGGMA